MTELDHVRQPLWWAPVVGRYRRLTRGQRAVLDVVVAELWRWPGPCDRVELSIPTLARRSGVSERHAGRSIRVLTGAPGQLLEINPPMLGLNVLRDVTSAARPSHGARVVALNDWHDWHWGQFPRPADDEVARSARALAPSSAEAWAEMIRRAVVVDEAPVPVRGPTFSHWAAPLEVLVARGYPIAALDLVLGEVARDDHLRELCRGVEAPRVIVEHWEGLFLRARRRWTEPRSSPFVKEVLGVPFDGPLVPMKNASGRPR